MYRRPNQPQNQQQAIPHRLPKQPNTPTERDLQIAFHEAGKVKTVVELNWGPDGKPGWLLTIQPGNDPLWALYEGDMPNDNPLFKEVSRDLGLIHTWITQCVPEDVAPLAAPSAALASVKNPIEMLPADTSKASLQGRLENMDIATLVQSIQMSKMSGRLQLFDQGVTAQVYFVDGLPVHAVNFETSGDPAVVEIFTWEKGDFRFFPEENTQERTVKRRIDGMIMEGITLLDQHKFLRKQGLKSDSYLVRKEQRITPEEFKARISQGAPLDLTLQMQMYEQCDGRLRWQDILAKRPLMKTEWIPVLFNLTSCGLITILEASPFAGKASGLVSAELDRGMITQVLRNLMRAETGMYTYAALQYFIEREFHKSISLGMPLSLIVFESRIILDPKDPPQPLPVQALREISSRIDSLKRPFDILGHYETFDFAILLPGAAAKSARMFGHKVAEMLINSQLILGQSKPLLLAGGLASVPEDTQDLGRFLAAAREAKAKAKEARVPLKAFSEL